MQHVLIDSFSIPIARGETKKREEVSDLWMSSTAIPNGHNLSFSSLSFFFLKERERKKKENRQSRSCNRLAVDPFFPFPFLSLKREREERDREVSVHGESIFNLHSWTGRHFPDES